MIKYTGRKDLGVAQLGARYLGVVEAASSSLVTQTKLSLENIEFSRLYFLLVTQLFRGVLRNLLRRFV